MTLRAVSAVLTLACMALACTPVLDWREVRPEGAGLLALFPCKPAGHVRRIVLVETPVEMTIYACAAGGATYAVAFADLGQAQWVERGLLVLAESAARNIGAAPSAQDVPASVPGMTPNPRAQRLSLVGRLADGQPVQEQVVVFSRGTRVYQATVVGAHLGGEAIDMFFGALRLQG